MSEVEAGEPESAVGKKDADCGGSACRVRLCYAPLPSVMGWIAVHHWFVLTIVAPDGTREARWEVWQRPDAGGTSWGHLHRDLMRPDRGVGGGSAVVEAEWTGEAAERIRRVLERPEEYPFRNRYRYWPGRNSNTYAAWVLAQAGIPLRMDWRAFGQGFARRISSDRASPSATGGG